MNVDISLMIDSKFDQISQNTRSILGYYLLFPEDSSLSLEEIGRNLDIPLGEICVAVAELVNLGVIEPEEAESISEEEEVQGKKQRRRRGENRKEVTAFLKKHPNLFFTPTTIWASLNHIPRQSVTSALHAMKRDNLVAYNDGLWSAAGQV